MSADVIRQCYVIRRSDKILLPPAQAAFDFMAGEAPDLLPSVPDLDARR